MKTHTVVIADDHPIVCKAIGQALENEERFDLVGQANNGIELLTIAQEIQPDIAILDLEMPLMKGYEVIGKLQEICPAIKTIAFSGYLTEENQERAIRSGADATLCKTESISCLIDALGSVITGQSYHSDVASKEITTPVNNRGLNALTLREKQILKLIALGKTSKQVSNECNISKWTVDKHRANIKEKLELHTLADMVRYAVEHGYIDP